MVFINWSSLIQSFIFYQLPPQKDLKSPYKKATTQHEKAPVGNPSSFWDAALTLQEVRDQRATLEANLEAVFRTRQEAEVYTIMETLYQEGYVWKPSIPSWRHSTRRVTAIFNWQYVILLNDKWKFCVKKTIMKFWGVLFELGEKELIFLCIFIVSKNYFW